MLLQGNAVFIILMVSAGYGETDAVQLKSLNIPYRNDIFLNHTAVFSKLDGYPPDFLFAGNSFREPGHDHVRHLIQIGCIGGLPGYAVSGKQQIQVFYFFQILPIFPQTDLHLPFLLRFFGLDDAFKHRLQCQQFLLFQKIAA